MINDYFGIQRTLRSTVLQKVVPQVGEHLRQSERGWGAVNVENKAQQKLLRCYLSRIRELVDGRCYIWSRCECRAGEAPSKINTRLYPNDPNRNTHLSKPAFIKVVCPTSNYRIVGQPGGQTQQGPLGGCSLDPPTKKNTH